MLTREDLEEITARYHRPDWSGFDRSQAVLDLGRLVGHALDCAQQLAVQQDAMAGLSRQWNDQRDARLAAERERDSLAIRLPMVVAAGDALAEAIAAGEAGQAELGLWRAVRGAGEVGRDE